MGEPRLCRALASVHPERIASEAVLEELLRALVARARAAHPSFALQVGDAMGDGDGAFVRHLASQLVGEVDLAELAATHIEDLYVAFACIRRVPAAHRALHALVSQPPSRMARRWGVAASSVELVRERLLVRALVGERACEGEGAGEGSPALLRYSGRGSLSAWLDTLGRRIGSALRDEEARCRCLPVTDALVALAEADPELALLRSRDSGALREAVLETLRAIPRRERTMLRLHTRGGLSLDALGRIFHLHRATIARTLGATRARIVEGVRRRLMERLDLSVSETDSLIRQLRGQLELSAELWSP